MEPITRRETLLNQIANNTSGNTGSINMEPITREETYLKQIADNTASGGGGDSDLPDTPAQDGTYTLQNTVSSGAGTLAWGSGGGGENLVVHMDADAFTLDKTWQEIFTAVSTGISASVSSAMDAVAELCPIVKVFSGDDGYYVSAVAIDNTGYSSVVYTYIATTANDYPAMD